MKKIVLLIAMVLTFVMPICSQISSNGFPTSEGKVIFKGFPEKDPSDVLGVPISENIYLLLALGLGYAAIKGIKIYRHKKKFYDYD